MWPGEKEYGITKKDYRFAGFTRPQDDMKYGYDREHEDQLVVKCNESIAEVFCDPNIFERRIAKHERTPITCPATKDLYGNVIYTDDPEYYCVGSGDMGGGKVFWTPYSTQDKMLREKLLADDMCDNCKTLAHELQHGIGSHAEFDSLTDIPGYLFRIDNFPKGQRLEHHLTSIYMGMERVATDVQMGREIPWYMRSRRNVFCSLMTRRPKQYREILRADGWDEKRVNGVVRDLCKI
jgi:hypothetical protein